MTSDLFPSGFPRGPTTEGTKDIGAIDFPDQVWLETKRITWLDGGRELAWRVIVLYDPDDSTVTAEDAEVFLSWEQMRDLVAAYRQLEASTEP